MIKSTLLKVYLFYKKYFFIHRGKFFVSNLLQKALGDICTKADNGNYLYLKANSSMDLSYLEHNPTYIEIMEVINELKEGDVFVDVGANIGYFSFYASARVGNSGRVYAFEPSDREYERFLKGMKINNLKNIIPYHIALTDYTGIVEFTIEPFHTGLNALSVANGCASPKTKVLKPCDTLDRILNCTKINLLKLDVEGAEVLVLKGAQKLLSGKKIEKLIVEITPHFLNAFGSSKEELYTIMRNAGYRPTIKSEASQFDEVFVLNNAN